LQLVDICKENNDDDIRQVLRSLPRDLNETYARILEKIIEHRKPDVAKKILNWIACARRPLRLDELGEAISFEAGDTLWDQGRRRFPISLTRMLQNCGNIVTVTHSEDGDVIQIVHYTAFEFLLSQSSKAVGLGFHMEMREANNLIGSVCVIYLSLADFETQVTSLPKKKAVDLAPSGLIASLLPSTMRRVWSFAARHFRKSSSQFDVGEILGARTTIKLSDALKQKFRLLEYATEHWINHYSDLSPDNYDASAWRLFEDLTQSGRLPLPWELDDSSNDLPYAAQFRWAVRNGHAGIFMLTVGRVKEGIEEYIKLDCGGVTPIFLCCSLGHDVLVQMLLGYGINLQERSQDRTVLQVAAAGDHLAVIDQLLRAKADVNEPAGSNCGRTALQAAAEQGHLAVIDRLLQAKADVNAPAGSNRGRTALQAAAGGRNLAVIDLLLQAKADVNAPAGSKRGRTALQAAAGGGHLAVIDRLLQA
jgi:ankyrin repeat protein